MILFAGAYHDTLIKFAHPNLGRLVQPRDYGQIAATAALGIPWAADNDAFGGWDETRASRFIGMLGKLIDVPGCRFVNCPDVVGDHAATLDLFWDWSWVIRKMGLPVGFVLQDGVTLDQVPWDELDAVFVGGTTEFKMGYVAAQAVVEAKRRGKWAHMGRVNSERRITYAGAIGCDSFDGTCFSQWRDLYLPWGLRIAAADRQLGMVG